LLGAFAFFDYNMSIILAEHYQSEVDNMLKIINDFANIVRLTSVSVVLSGGQEASLLDGGQHS
jgi:hypothetical protein